MYFNHKPSGSDDAENLPETLRGLLASYRETLPDPEASANFMPALWTRIEAKQKLGYSFGRFSRRLVAAAGVFCLLMSGLLIAPMSQTQTLYTATYVDVLANEHVDEVAVDVESNHSEKL